MSLKQWLKTLRYKEKKNKGLLDMMDRGNDLNKILKDSLNRI